MSTCINLSAMRKGKIVLSSSLVCEVIFDNPDMIIITRDDIYPAYNKVIVGYLNKEKDEI